MSEDPLVVLAAGKAAVQMAIAAARWAGPRIRAGLIVALEVGTGGPDDGARGDEAHGNDARGNDALAGFEAIAGGHPVPTESSERAGRRALELATSVSRDETLLVLLSGGASALMAVPASGLTLADKRATTQVLLRAGADIHALNTVRKHLSAIKGGWLAVRAGGRCRALVISDVVDNDLSVVASGPTVPDSSTFHDALDVLQRFGGESSYPAPVVARLKQGNLSRTPPARIIEDTPKPGDPRLARTTTAIIGSRLDAMTGASEEAEKRGYHVVTLPEPVVGEARVAARSYLRDVLAAAKELPRPVCVVSSGETTVRVTGNGKGGRNQELALALVEPLAHFENDIVLVSVGTDGVDGPTDAAGAWVDNDTLSRALANGVHPRDYLDENNSYPFFNACDGLIRTGPTGTNVGDLQVILLA